MREVSLALVVTAVVVVLGAAFGAPVGAPANPGMSPNPAKAPWYFLGLQELLIHFHPVVAIVVIPLAGAGVLLLLPYFTADDEPTGAWFLSDRGWRAARLASLVALAITPAAVLSHEVVSRAWPGAAGGLMGGPVALAAIGAGTFAFLRATRSRLALSRNETVQTAVVLAASPSRCSPSSASGSGAPACRSCGPGSGERRWHDASPLASGRPASRCPAAGGAAARRRTAARGRTRGPAPGINARSGAGTG